MLTSAHAMLDVANPRAVPSPVNQPSPMLSATRRRQLVGLGRRSSLGAAIFTCVALSAGCATQRIVRPPSSMRIFNQSRQPIVAVQTKRCGEADSMFKPIANSEIGRGGSYTLPLLDGCVELIAVGPDGQIMGRQADLRMMPGSTWTIR